MANTTQIFNSTITSFSVTNSSVCNNTYYVTSSSGDPLYGLTYTIGNTIWIVFDNITATYDSYTDVTAYAKVYRVSFDQLKWQWNGSAIGADWVCLNMRNSSIMSTATTLFNSYLNPFMQEISMPVSWTGLLYQNNATKTINGTSYNFVWFTEELTIYLWNGEPP